MLLGLFFGKKFRVLCWVDVALFVVVGDDLYAFIVLCGWVKWHLGGQQWRHVELGPCILVLW